MATAQAFAAGELAQTFTLDGQLTKSNDQPLLDSNAKVVVQILDPSKTCVLYEEQQFVNTAGSNGYYNIQVGSVTGATKRTTGDPGRTMVQVYQNSTAITANSAAGQTCAGGAYTPAVNDARYFRLIVTPSATNVADTLSPDTMMDSVATSLVAQTLQGLPASQFLQIGTGDLTQANLQTVFAAGNATKLTTLLSVPAANYVTKDATNGTILIPTANSPGSPQAGQIWYDAGALKYWNGTTAQTLGTSAGVTSVTAGNGLNVGAGPGGMITTTGTLNVDTGTNAGQIVQVQTGGKLPALDASNLTALNGTQIQSGTIGGTTAISTTGNIQTSADLTAKRLFLQDGTTNYIGLKAPGAVTAYNLTLPSAQGGANTFLKNDGSGNLSFAAPTFAEVGGTVNLATQVTGTLPEANGGTGATTLASVAVVKGGQAGAVTLGTNNATALTLNTSNTARVTVLSDGKVGIGTSTPIAALQIGSQSNQANPMQVYIGNAPTTSRPTIVANWNSSALWGIGPATGNNDNTVRIGNVANTDTDWAATQNLNLVIGGNVGIGTATPSAGMHVAVSAASSKPMALISGTWFTSGSSTTNKPQLLIEVAGTTSTGWNGSGTGFGINAPNTFSGALADFQVNGSSQVQIGANGNIISNGDIYATNLYPSGKVGIGTTSPNQLLTVEGPMSLRTQAAPTATANYGKIYVDSGDSNKLKYMNPGGSIVDLSAGGGGGSQWTTSGPDIYFTGGKVGIGTNSPNAVFHAPGILADNPMGAWGLALGNQIPISAYNIAMTTSNNVGNDGVNGILIAQGNAAIDSSSSSNVVLGNLMVGAASSVGGVVIGNNVHNFGTTNAITIGSGTYDPNSNAGNLANTQSNSVYIGANSSSPSIVVISGSGATPGNVGIGTTSPTASLDVKGHIGNSAATAPGLSSCGTSPAITGNDTRGTVTFGSSGAPASCTLTFATAFASAPYCVITQNGGTPTAVHSSVTTSTTTLVINTSAGTNSLKFNYFCMQ